MQFAGHHVFAVIGEIASVSVHMVAKGDKDYNNRGVMLNSNIGIQ